MIKPLDKSSFLIYNAIKKLDKEIAMKEKLKKLRLEARLTQKEAAEKIGVGQPTVSMWENGESKPRIDMLPIIAEAYGCDVKDIFDAE